MITYLLLDLDNTLYPKSSGLGHRMGELMGQFVIDHLGISESEVTPLRRAGLQKHGTTLRWLMEEHGMLDAEPFIAAVHPTNLDEFLTHQDRLTAQEALDAVDLPASILTNSPAEHARRVLEWLGLTNRFEHVFDLRYNQMEGKPHTGAYQRALEKVGAKPAETLFADDVLQYVLPFRDLGGIGVHIASESAGAPGIRTIGSIAELAGTVAELRSGNES